MDLQNVSNINVPQGEVRTIHDKDNRLLWGRVSYDTTYRGDTTQQTYNGYNLIDLVPITNMTISASQQCTTEVVVDSTLGRSVLHISGTSNYPTVVYQLPQRLESGKYYALKYTYRSSMGSTATHPEMWFAPNWNFNNWDVLGSLNTVRCKGGDGDSGRATLQSTTWKTTSRRFYVDPTQYTNDSTSYSKICFSLGYNSNASGFEGKEVWLADAEIYEITEAEWNANTYTSKNFEQYVGGVPSPNPDYPQSIDVVTGEQSIKIRTGKNMIDLNSASVGYLVLHTNGELGPNPNYSASDWIPVKAGSHYYQTATNVWYACYYDKNKNFIAQINSRYIRPTQDGYIRTSWENTKADQVMMEVGDSGTIYEAYQGKSHDVDLTSKNLFDSSLLPASWSNAAIITITLKVKPNTKYTMSSDIPLDRGLYANLFFYDNSGTGSTATNGVATNKPVTVTTLSDGILKVGYRSNYQSITINRDDYWYQIEEGETVTPYTPYFTPIELAKVGTYQDYIYKSGGNWYVHKAVGKGVLDGSENDWGYQNGVFRTFFDDAMRDINAVLVMSDYFTGQTTRYRDDISNSCCAKVIGANSQIGFRYDAMNGDVPTWKSWLSTHNTTIYYVLATATNTQITDVTLLSQLNAVHQWLTRYGYQYGVVGTLPIIIDQEDLS